MDDSIKNAHRLQKLDAGAVLLIFRRFFSQSKTPQIRPSLYINTSIITIKKQLNFDGFIMGMIFVEKLIHPSNNFHCSSNGRTVHYAEWFCTACTFNQTLGFQ
ncbi:hypothetical protein XELAEV_18030766mg [Xenopus laevis]|uniref:Uncharacterized protein n=1 Tax=Xenopus laevis TaxID=8355 RepID=A0A974CM32_XENLA|nr:hypothetical protein XELAEV_18030766mg [Xenopus laevis]